MGHIRHFIWDFDGTVADTYPAIIQSLRDALREFGHDCDPVEAMGLMLQDIPTAHAYYAGQFGLDREELNRTHQKHQALRLRHVPPMEGIREVLAHICATGRHNYIFTNHSAGQTLARLKKYGLDRYFREIVGEESPCFAYKPAPDAVLYLMDKYEMSGHDTAMIGDRECDLRCAHNAGIAGAHYVCDLVPQALPCHWRVESYRQMLALL